MLVFALVLIAGSLVTAIALIIFLSENLLPLLFAAMAGQFAFASGGGWPGAVLTGAITFTVVSAAIRVIFALTSYPVLRLGLAAVVVAPAALATFVLAEALAGLFVPASSWRTALAFFATSVAAAVVHRRLAGPSEDA